MLLYVKKPSIQVELRQFYEAFSFDTHSTPTNLSLLPILKFFDFFQKKTFFSLKKTVIFSRNLKFHMYLTIFTVSVAFLGKFRIMWY